MFFIVSSGRSGTTLLCSMLNAGGEVFIPQESDFLARGFHRYAARTTLADADYRSIVELFGKSSQSQGWGIKDELLVALRERRPQTFPDVNATIYETALLHFGAAGRRWGIKAPVLIAAVDKIFSVFPHAKVVHLVRDGRDVFLSYRKVNEQLAGRGFGPAGVTTAALYWIDGLRRIEEVQGDERLFELRYEDLIADPEQELKHLCTFLGIEYSDRMHTDFQTSEATGHLILDKHKGTIHSKITVAGGLDRSNSGKFSSQMARSQRIVFELLAAPYLQKYRYPLEWPRLTAGAFSPVRAVANSLARFYNDIRYRLRAERTWRKVRNNTQRAAPTGASPARSDSGSPDRENPT